MNVEWRKSRYSSAQGNCVEVAAWRKSSYSSDQGNCVEAALGEQGVIAVRDSKDPDGPVLEFTPDQWREFTRRRRGPAVAEPAFGESRQPA